MLVLLKGYHILMASIQSGLYTDRELVGQLCSPYDAGTIQVDEIMFVLIAREAWSYLWPIMENDICVYAWKHEGNAGGQ
jgi:hypothetical protein